MKTTKINLLVFAALIAYPFYGAQARSARNHYKKKTHSKYAEKYSETERALPPIDKAHPFEGVNWTFYGDGYFTYNMNNPNQGANGVAGQSPTNQENTYYEYNRTSNSMEMNVVGVKAQKDFGDFAALVQVDFGPQADYQNGVSNARNISQAYLTLKPEALNGWKLELGKMLSHVGFESQYAEENWNYSRSLITYYGTPVWHVGARFIAPPSIGKIRPTFYIYNSSDTSTMENNNKQLDFGARLDFAVTPRIDLQYNVIGGPEQAQNVGSTRVVHELNAVYRHSDRLTFAGDFNYGSDTKVTFNGNEGTASWQGFALYAHYVANENWTWTPRFEVFQDKNSPNTLSASQDKESVTSVTVTAARRLGDNLESRIEARYDKSNYDNAFKDGDDPNKFTDNQTTVTAALLWSI